MSTAMGSVLANLLPTASMRTNHNGRIITITGPMFSGKTTALIATANMFVRCHIPVQIVAPNMSKRKESERERIESHDGVVPLCETNYVQCDQLLDHCTKYIKRDNNTMFAVCIDEAQFFSDLVNTCSMLRRAGIMVVVAGLALTFERRPFGEMHSLLDYADERIERKAVCGNCKTWNATLTHRTTDAKGTVVVGGADVYMPVCQLCFETLME